jgi:cysteine-rich repeat protein
MATHRSLIERGFGLPAALGVVAALASPAWAQDFQRIPADPQVTRLPGTALILPGPPAKPQQNDGRCDSFFKGAGDPNVPMQVVLGGDDVVHFEGGTSEPNRIAIKPGPDPNIDPGTVIGGDDPAGGGVICGGANATLDSAGPNLAGDDLVKTQDELCAVFCPGTPSCIVPGSDGTLQTGVLGDDARVSFVLTGANGVAETAAVGNDQQVIDVGKGFPDTVCVDVGPNGIAETSLCRNGVADHDETGVVNDDDCDDGNAVDGDGCDSNCTETACGNGIETLGEECDDGDQLNSNACVLGCTDAACGDGFLHAGVEECDPGRSPQTCGASCTRISQTCPNGVVDPGEECDDDNQSNRDDCPKTCENARCGDGFLHVKGMEPPGGFEECDDGDTLPGDGCDPDCKLECGNGRIDGVCMEGRVGAPCTTDPNCDTSPGAGDGGCTTKEECDPGRALFCDGPPVCSDQCKFLDCGNKKKECPGNAEFGEECDLGEGNGKANRGCDAGCRRKEIERPPRPTRDCLHAWTLDLAPGELRRGVLRCTDGDAGCDGDGADDGQCTFGVVSCLNLPGIAGCTPDTLAAFDMRRLNFKSAKRAREVPVAECITMKVEEVADALDPNHDDADSPNRCREGLRHKNCSIDRDCDRFFGVAAPQGACDVGTGVRFLTPLEPQAISLCSEKCEVTVPEGERLDLKVRVTRLAGQRDTDVLRLFCRR